MKIAPQFRAFLESYHYLVLPGIGRFDAVSTEVNPLTGEITAQQVQFCSDPGSKVCAAFIEFVVQNLKVDARLAESDLFSFCNSVKELLNQGFETEIPGIGFLHPDIHHQIIFSGKSIYSASPKRRTEKSTPVTGFSFWL